MISAIKKAAAILCAAVLVTACDSLPDGTVSIEGEQLFYVEADATTVNGGNPVRFSASDAWVAFPVGDAAEWLSVTPGAGVAGDCSVVIACSVNSGSQRSGTIRIKCGKGEADINVIQKGVPGTETDPDPKPDPDPDPKPDPVTPLKGQVSRILFNTISESGDFGSEWRVDYTCDFTYDDENRITGIDIVTTDAYGNEEGETYTENYSIDRSELGKITVTYTYSDDYGKEQEVDELLLDSAGRIGRLIPGDSEGMYYDLSYDDNGHLASVVCKGGPYDDEWNYGWNGGVLATVTCPAMPDYNLDYTGCYGDLPNGAMNIDINMFLGPLGMSGDGENEFPGTLNVLALLRMTGASSDRLLAISDGDEHLEPEVAFGGGWPEPNATEHQSHETRFDGYDRNLQYDADPDGLVRTITQYREKVVVLVEYDIVSTDQLWDPENPNMGYKYTKKNYTRKEISRTKNGISEVYKFEYRAN